jgi:hypothetical protein
MTNFVYYETLDLSEFPQPAATRNIITPALQLLDPEFMIAVFASVILAFRYFSVTLEASCFSTSLYIAKVLYSDITRTSPL